MYRGRVLSSDLTMKLSKLKISAGETLTIHQPMLAGGMLGG